MKKNKYALIFLGLTLALLIVNITIILVFTALNITNKFYSALNVSSLAIAFVSFIASTFFSFSVYLQTKNQNEINKTLPKKDDQYIISNYSLFNIEKEVSFFSLTGDEKNNVFILQKHLQVNEPDNNITRIVFLPTDSMNKPTYKVLVRSIDFFSSKNEILFSANAPQSTDGEYSANILDRGYNCINLDLPQNIKKIADVFSKSKSLQLKLDIISVFNVKMEVTFHVYIDSERNTEDNPDKAIISDLTTYTIHHTNYVIENKSILADNV